MMNDELKNEYLKVRKELIREEFSYLNDMQQTAVLATEGPLLILAGAGSGKTTVLINRIANLLKYGNASDCDEVPFDLSEGDLEILKQGGQKAKALAGHSRVEPWRILAITFTNKAAGELKSRLENMLGEQANDIWACTFHSACVRFLRRDAEKLGFGSNFTIYDSADSQSLVKHILKDLNIDDKNLQPRLILSKISNAKNAMIGPKEFEKQAIAEGDYMGRKIAVVYDEYMRRLFAANAMDFDDLIAFSVKLLKENDDVRDYWQRKFKYVLVDEYQDTNHLQYELVSLLSGFWGNICVVGDDDQSIYKFRGATIENILSFEDEFPGCRTIRLEQNYRSTGHILDAANNVIRNNTGRKGKELWTNQGDGEMLVHYVADDANDEASYVATDIMANYSKGSNWGDHAVLYRMNAQSNQLEYAFKRNAIPYKIIGGMRFFDRAEIKDMLSYLALIASPNDDLRLMRIINNPPRGIGEKTVDTISTLARRNGCAMYDIIRNASNYPELSRALSKLESFSALIDRLRAFAENNTPDLLLSEIIDETGYVLMLTMKGDLEGNTKAENVQELKTSIIEYMQESGDSSLDGYLANVALYSDLDNIDKDADAVVMMTIHSAKGLEFENVYVVGMEETIFPGMRAIGDGVEMEEERRLCYVALTRAKKKLCLISARERMIFGRTMANRVSRFVSEIPDYDIKKNIPQGYGYKDRSKYADQYYSSPKKEKQENKSPFFSISNTPKKPPENFAVGDRINHKAFGEGFISKMTPMGGDYLIEVNFQTCGVKKLMLRAAANVMKKI